jgi:hypothetical protein
VQDVEDVSGAAYEDEGVYRHLSFRFPKASWE